MPRPETLTPFEEDLERDRWGRPIILTPDGTREPYTRPSTLARTLSDTVSLERWKCRQTAIGIATRRDLSALVATHRGDKRKLDEVVELAMEAADSGQAARLGTALHAATAAYDLGGTLDDVPAALLDDVAAYARATEHLQVVGVEQFVVCHRWKTAGTFDRVYRLEDGRTVVADLKTGSPDSVKYGALEWAVQICVYANSDLYDPKTGQTRPLDPDLDRMTGLVVHLPESSGECSIYEVNLKEAERAVAGALWVRQWRARKDIVRPYTRPIPVRESGTKQRTNRKGTK